MVRRTTSNFGASLTKYIGEAHSTQNATASAAGMSQPYLNQLISGKRAADPKWIEIISDTLKLAEDQRRELHRAAAQDLGFKL